jgi:uncharacterized short protein YbdD (DUF466 family)
MKKAVKRVWECVRTVTGDNAYDRYLQHHALNHRGIPPLSRREFYKQYTNEKWSGINRCC